MNSQSHRTNCKSKNKQGKSHKETYTHKRKTNKQTKLTVRTLGQIVKVNLNRQNHTKKHTHTHSQKEKKGKNFFN